MPTSTIARNTLVAPFSVNTPLIDNPKKPVVATSHQKWLQSVANGVNGSAQLQALPPTSSASPGQPGTFSFDANFLYVAVGQNIWRRVALSSF